jgi:2-C-methyl-D-erythritol 4-phosphate cytidylyltransferase/2-C-methyl-D-erythritol 2,4-cyclodiphosphate synthase
MAGPVCALILAAGRGVRFGGTENKVFAPLAGRPLIAWTLEAFARCDAIDAIVLVGSAGDMSRLRELGEAFGGGKYRVAVQGGNDRQSSVYLGLQACTSSSGNGGFEYIAVHDAARPCITPEIIAQGVAAAREHGAVTVAVRLADSLVRGPGNIIEEYVPRDGLWRVQTPQVFRRTLLEEAHQSANQNNIHATDDAGLVRRLGHPVYIVPGSPENLKVTEAADLMVAEAVVGEGKSPTSPTPNTQHPTPSPSPTTDPSASAPPTTNFRIGHGYDVHPFTEGRRLFLGGVEFPEATRGLLGHSDADVVLHAVCDAILGAAGLGDIGHFFPPSDPAHKDRRSTEFLAEVAARVRADGWAVANMDVTILAETPKIGPKADAMKQVIAGLLSVEVGQVGIKATTNERLGFIGRGEGIAVHATTLLYRTAG